MPETYSKSSRLKKRVKSSSQGEIQMPESSDKKVKKSKREIPPPYKLILKKMKKVVKRYPFLSDVGYAKLALAYCKEDLDQWELLFPVSEDDEEDIANFELDKVFGARRVLLRLPGSTKKYGVVDWCHVSFTAKPPKTDGTDASPVFFFVEMADWGDGVLHLMDFQKSKPDDSRITYGCGFCPSVDNKYPHLHPGSSFKAGSESVAVDAASQREMARCFKLQKLVKSFRRSLEPERDSEPQTILSANHEFAEIALKEINALENAEYEIVETYKANVEIMEVEEIGDWCHIAFTAKNRDYNTKFIFAELVIYRDTEYTLHGYSILDPDSPDIEWNKGCGFCPPGKGEHPHPAKYTAGHWSYTNGRAIRSSGKCSN